MMKHWALLPWLKRDDAPRPVFELSKRLSTNESLADRMDSRLISRRCLAHSTAEGLLIDHPAWGRRDFNRRPGFRLAHAFAWVAVAALLLVPWLP
jgi:hypothetical protein